MSFSLSIASIDEYSLAQHFLDVEGYRGDPISLDDEVLLARMNGIVIGIVRLSFEMGLLCLRGMRLQSEYRRQGIGTVMLNRLRIMILERPCYCLPYRHLDSFYAQIGFVVVEHLPEPLAERLAAYRQRELDVIGMARYPIHNRT
jgi:N-acetylglutamate synthase-like GNAT family acetyltransferase